MAATRGLLSYASQRIVSLCVVALFFVIYFGLWGNPQESVYPTLGNGERLALDTPNDSYYIGAVYRDQSTKDTISAMRLVFVIYSILVHILAATFPVRACLAVRHVTRRVRGAKAEQMGKHASQHTLETSGASHAIIIPNYKEDFETLQATLAVLASHPQASASYHVILAMEEAEENSDSKAKRLIAEMGPAFHAMTYTVHPAGIPGEARGKSSNIAWAAKVLLEQPFEKSMMHASPDVIVTVLDADSHLSSDHFTLISKMHLQFPDTAQTTLYVPPMVFDRNSDRVPRFVRVADMLWCGAGMSNLLPSEIIKPPTSVYSLPLNLVDQVNGWDAGPEAIGEDLHMYLKCFFKLKGNLTARPVWSPASQCNVCGDGEGVRGWIGSCAARWQQAIRHMWGSLDTGYSVQQTAKLYWEDSVFGPGDLEKAPTRSGSDSDEDSSSESGSPLLSCYPDPTAKILSPRFFILFYRLWEAHFLPVHLTTILIASSIYTATRAPTDITPDLVWTFWLTGYLRFFGYLGMVLFMISYREYHKVCIFAREAEMRQAGLSDRVDFAHCNGWWYYADCFIFPVAGTIFGSVPAVWAQMRQLWTVHLKYTVSLKPKVLVAELRKKVVPGSRQGSPLLEAANKR